jgi:hypothetical protein
LVSPFAEDDLVGDLPLKNSAVVVDRVVVVVLAIVVVVVVLLRVVLVDPDQDETVAVGVEE